MKLKEIQFKEPASKRIYDKYMSQVRKTVKPLRTQEQNDILLEMNSHIYEGLQHHKQNNEVNALLDILDKLGVPDEVLTPLVADKKLEQAIRTFNPLHVFKALALNISNGVSSVIFFLLYVCLFGFVFMIGAKIVYPNEVGLFFLNGKVMALGKINSAYVNDTGYNEILGNWLIPVMLLSIVVFYLLITLLLKLKRKINKK